MSLKLSKSPRAIETSESVHSVSAQDEIPTLEVPDYTDTTEAGEQGVTKPSEVTNRKTGLRAKDLSKLPRTSKILEATYSETLEDLLQKPTRSSAVGPASSKKGFSYRYHKDPSRRLQYHKRHPHHILRPVPHKALDFTPPHPICPTSHQFLHVTPSHHLSPALIASSYFRNIHPHTYMAYQLQYRFPPTTLPLPFSFHVLLGPLPENRDWFNATARVGGHGIAAGHTEKNSITGKVPLTRLLLDRLGGLEEEVVVPYLKKELKWIFEQDNGEGAPVELEKLKGVRVRVASAQVNISEAEDPKWVFYESAVGGTKDCICIHTPERNGE